MNIPFISVKGNPAVRMLEFHHVTRAPENFVRVVFGELFRGDANLCVEAVEAGPQFYRNVPEFLVIVGEHDKTVGFVQGFVHFVGGSGVFVPAAEACVKVEGGIFEECPKKASAESAPVVVLVADIAHSLCAEYQLFVA